MSAQISSQGLIVTGGFRQSVGILRIGEQLDAAVLENWLLGGQGTGLLVFRGQIARGNLAGFDIGLIEGVDADD